MSNLDDFLTPTLTRQLQAEQPRHRSLVTVERWRWTVVPLVGCRRRGWSGCRPGRPVTRRAHDQAERGILNRLASTLKSLWEVGRVRGPQRHLRRKPKGAPGR